jgi:hypothetical protein
MPTRAFLWSPQGGRAYVHHDGYPTSVVPRLLAYEHCYEGGLAFLHDDLFGYGSAGIAWSGLLDELSPGSSTVDPALTHQTAGEAYCHFSYLLDRDGVTVFVYGQDGKPYSIATWRWLSKGDDLDPWNLHDEWLSRQRRPSPRCEPLNVGDGGPGDCTSQALWELSYRTTEQVDGEPNLTVPVCTRHMREEVDLLTDAWNGPGIEMLHVTVRLHQGGGG